MLLGLKYTILSCFFALAASASFAGENETALPNIPAIQNAAFLETPSRENPFKGRPYAIGLSNVVSYTLSTQWDIKISIEEVFRQKGLLQKSMGAFDYIFQGNQRLIWKDNVQQIGFKSDKSGFFNSTAAGVDHTARIGTKYSLRAEIDQEYNPIFLFNFPPYNRINNYVISFTIDQPLLRNFLINQNYALEQIKRLDVGSAKYDMVQTISERIRDVVQAYWDVVAAKKIYEIESEKKKRLVDLAKKSLELIKGGQLAASELDQQYAEIYREDRRVVAAEQAVYAALNQMLLLMGGEDECPPIQIPNLILEDYPEIIKEDLLNVCCMASLAIERRPDLLAQYLRTAGTQVQLYAAENGLLPELNLKVGENFHNFVLNDKAKPFFGAVNSRLPERNFSIELNVSIPLFNDDARGEYVRSRAENLQSLYQQENVIESIKYNVAIARNNHSSLIEQLNFANDAVKWYEITLKEERKKLIEGFSTIFIVVDFEDRLGNVLIERTQAYTDYAKNLVDLLYLTGTLVDYDECIEHVYLTNVTRIDHLLKKESSGD